MIQHDVTDPQALTVDWRMDRIMQDYPAAHRALIETFGIQRVSGPHGPGYAPEDLLADVLASHGADPAEAITSILDLHAMAQDCEITVQKAAERLGLDEVVLLDVREPRAFAMAHVPSSRCIDGDLAKEIVADWPRDTPMVLVCHHGMRSLDAVAFLQAHGFTNVKSLRGGVDAWSVEIDPRVPRY